MRARIPFLLLAIGLAVVFVRLGLWQLDRRAERRAANRVLAERLDAPPVPFAALPTDTGLVRYRRATLTGAADYANEVVVANRTRNGSPGVHFLTPLRIAGDSVAVLVNRGWVYAPDGTSPAAGDWREDDTLTVTGFLGTLPGAAEATPAPEGRPRVALRLDHPTIQARVPYPVRARYLVVSDTVDPAVAATPVRVPPPLPTDEGPHLAYAVQWFAFALIAVGGAVIAARSSRVAPPR